MKASKKQAKRLERRQKAYAAMTTQPKFKFHKPGSKPGFSA